MSINIASEIVHFAGHIASPPAPPLSRSTRHGLSGIGCRPVQRVQRPGVRAGVPCLAWSALHLARPALLPVVCSPSGCAGGGMGAPAGYIAAAQPRPVGLPTTEKIKKTHPILTKRNVCHCASLQKFRKIQKDPFRSLDCGIIS